MAESPWNSFLPASNLLGTWPEPNPPALNSLARLASPTLLGGLSSASLSTTPNALAFPPSLSWRYVTRRFTQFLSNIELTTNQITDGQRKCRGVIACLNWAYYGHGSETENAFLIGSWAKGTRVRPPRDVDLYFLLPAAVYHRFDTYQGYRQSALLQEVKGKLLTKYPGSDIKGDGPVVLAAFESYSIEIVPAFALTEEHAYFVCDTKDGGAYKKTRPWDEAVAINTADQRNANNVRPLIRMLKVWQDWCSVPIKSFYLELLAIEFLDQCAWRHQDHFYYDWICRDFFEWMVKKANTYLVAPNMSELFWLGNDWQSKAESAYRRANLACGFERENAMNDAGEMWQMIFGSNIPRNP